jgi:multidrug efflux pump subunit AcrB
MTLVPVFAVHFLHAENRTADVARRGWRSWLPRIAATTERVHRPYRRLMERAIGARWRVLVGVGFLFVGSLLLDPLLGRQLFPAVDAGQVFVRMRAPSGTSIDNIEKLAFAAKPRFDVSFHPRTSTSSSLIRAFCMTGPRLTRPTPARWTPCLPCSLQASMAPRRRSMRGGCVWRWLLNRSEAPVEASHLNLAQVTDIYSDIDGRYTAGVVQDLQQRLDKLDFPSNYKVTLHGEIETMNSSFRGMGLGLAMAIVLVYLLLVAKFCSFVDPAIILASVPLGITSA